MQLDYEYLIFVVQQSTGKTSRYHCTTKSAGALLGEVKWHSPWRQYCYFPQIQAVYSAGCMTDIAHFVKQLNDARKAG
jgi:hypothetical protein